MDRRGFVKFMAFTGLTVVTAGGTYAFASSGDSGKSATSASGNASDSAQTTSASGSVSGSAQNQADIIIVGAGIGGLAAAIHAAESGKSVIVLEKEEISGGSARFSEGTIYAAGTKMQKEQGYGDSTIDSLIDGIRQENPEYSETGDTLAQTLYAGAKDMIDELSAAGLTFAAIDESDPTACSVDGQGAALMSFLEERGTDLGISPVYKKSVKALITKRGKVVGVSCTDGTEYQGDAVILATGGFTSNMELVKKYSPEYSSVRSIAASGSTGDGLLMAMDADAGTTALDTGEDSFCVCKGSVMDTSDLPTGTPSIVVNKDGDRFLSEDLDYSDASTLTVTQPESRSYIVFDGTMLDSFESLQSYIDKGYAEQADSVDALAKKIGTKDLATTVETYNKNAESGADPVFGRTSNIQKLIGPKYYAISNEPVMYASHGGLVIDKGAHVLDGSGKSIAGLYACGEVCASCDIRDGLAFTSALSQGYVFGKIAVDSIIAD